MPAWSFLTNHGRALVCIGRDPDVRLRDIAASLSITERHAFSIVADLTEAGFITKTKHRRRNRYEIQPFIPEGKLIDGDRATATVLELLLATEDRRRSGRRTSD